MSKRKNVIRINDRVRILNPQIFVRCGYPLTVQIVKDTIITQKQKDAIWTMLEAFNIPNIPDRVQDNYFVFTKADNKTYEKILHDMAWVVLGQKGWGGKDRKIYAEYKPELLDREFQVISKRVVKTGTHISGHSYRDYFSSYDEYDPPYLMNEKTHIILKLSSDTFTDKEIEQCCVVKI